MLPTEVWTPLGGMPAVAACVEEPSAPSTLMMGSSTNNSEYSLPWRSKWASSRETVPI